MRLFFEPSTISNEIRLFAEEFNRYMDKFRSSSSRATHNYFNCNEQYQAETMIVKYLNNKDNANTCCELMHLQGPRFVGFPSNIRMLWVYQKFVDRLINTYFF